MDLNDADLKVERIKGKGAGGQHKNKTSSRIRLTHIPTGVQVSIDGRDQHRNLRVAKKELVRRLLELKAGKKSAAKKAKRDDAIKNTPTIRTYDFKKGVVKDHRSGKIAPLKKILNGHLELLRSDDPSDE